MKTLERLRLQRDDLHFAVRFIPFRLRTPDRFSRVRQLVSLFQILQF
jgi:hypothetical protein